MGSGSTKFKELPKFLLIAAFLGLLFLPTLDSFFGLDKAPAPNERRVPAPFPAYNATTNGVKGFVVGLESYFNDHFGFRKRLIRWNNRWKKSWFKDSSLADVVTGKEGWYYFSGGGMIEHYRGTRLFTREELLAWEGLLEGRRDWLAQQGIKYLFVIPPDKQSVYPEHLPEWLTRVSPTNKLDQFIEHMKANSTLEIVDLRQPLIDQKSVGRLYMYTDSHWNMLGGFFAYRTMVNRLKKNFPDLQPLELSQFEQKAEDQPGGDLARMLGQEASLIEKDYVTLYARESVQPFETAVLTNFLNKTWTPLAEPVRTRHPAGRYRAIMFRDSFSGNLIPFLGFNFKEAYFIWQYNWNKAFIEQQKPDVVIDAMLQRYLYTTDPNKLKALDESPDSTMASHNQ